MEISKILTVSTAHITEKTAKELRNAVEMMGSNIDMCVYEKKGYGFFIHVPDGWECECEIPSDLMDCIKQTRNNGCEWLCLDRDAEIESVLPVYEWSNEI